VHGRSSAGIVSWVGSVHLPHWTSRNSREPQEPSSVLAQPTPCLSCQPASLFPGGWLLLDGQPEDLASLGALLRSSVEPPAINVHSPCRHPVSRAPLSMAFSSHCGLHACPALHRHCHKYCVGQGTAAILLRHAKRHPRAVTEQTRPSANSEDARLGSSGSKQSGSPSAPPLSLNKVELCR
jgi:hypothetical protein